MSRELYFLRSSEQKIVVDMFALAHPDKKDFPEEIEKHTAFYGLTRKDLGLYAMVDNSIAGAIWARKFQDEAYATLSLGVLDGFDFVKIANSMMEQFLLEAASQFEELRVEINANEKLKEFYESFGFFYKEKNIWHLKLEKKEIVRPSDGYDPRKWMD